MPVNYEANSGGPLNIPFSKEELLSSISEASNSAPGPDDIHNSMIKNLTDAALDDLLKLYNNIFQGRTYPSSWSSSIIIPLLKQGQDKTSASSYRPISLTSCLSKVLERMVNRRLVWFLEHNNLLAPEQSGFQQGRSTSDHLVSMETAICNAFIEKKSLVAVSFDIRKAYDTAWRRLIINQLKEWGVGGHMLAFADNFLKDSSIQVRLGDILSATYDLENGISKGRVFSCTLFAIAINKIKSCTVLPVRCCIFVDDFFVYVAAKRIASAERALQLTINRLENWSTKTGFSFSAGKTQCIVFSRQRNVREPILTMEGRRLAPQTSIKFLGVIFDSRLTWVPHLKYLKAKCLKRLNMLRALSGTKWGADRSCMLRFYKAVIRSCLDYGCIVYGSARPNALKMLDSIHHSALRLATGAFRSSPTPSLLAEVGEPSLHHRRIQLSLNYFHALKSKPDVPTYEDVHNNPLNLAYEARPKLPAPLGVRCKRYIEMLGIPEFTIRRLYPCDVPPWVVPEPTVDVTLSVYNKDETPCSVYQAEYRRIIQTHRPCDTVYTDGSKKHAETGCAVVTFNNCYTFRLPDHSTIYSAELTAIDKALNVTHSGSGKLVICTDSLSSILAIQNMYPKHPIIRNIRTSLYNLQIQGTKVVLMWVPGHVGIGGNEIADRAAKESLGLIPFTRRIIATDTTSVVKDKLKGAWHHEWRNVQNNKLRQIKDNVHVWETSVRKCRREEVVLCRLRIGHTLLTHGHLMNQSDPPICDRCNCAITVKHILCECSKFRRIRQLWKIQPRIQDVLKNDEKTIQNLFNFLNDAALLNSI